MELVAGLKAPMIGMIGEYFAMTVIASAGLVPHRVDFPNCDLVVERGSELLRIEVKTQARPSMRNRGKARGAGGQEYYRFMTHRSRRNASSPGLIPYRRGDFDLMALVGLEHDKIAFLTFEEIRPRMSFPSPEMAKPEQARRRWEDHTLEAALSKLGSA